VRRSPGVPTVFVSHRAPTGLLFRQKVLEPTAPTEIKNTHGAAESQGSEGGDARVRLMEMPPNSAMPIL
jgi:hypothetical protein